MSKRKKDKQKTLTAAELIKQLSEYPPDAGIFVGFDDEFVPRYSAATSVAYDDDNTVIHELPQNMVRITSEATYPNKPTEYKDMTIWDFICTINDNDIPYDTPMRAVFLEYGAGRACRIGSLSLDDGVLRIEVGTAYELSKNDKDYLILLPKSEWEAELNKNLKAEQK